MATYIIGDLQGCFDPLQALLKQINYQPEQDELWFVGDIVNRGPQSLECLRFVKSLGDRGKMVLGNHDFHLLASDCGVEKYLSKSDTLKPILKAPDRAELIDWLRHQPLIIQHPSLAMVMVHAGIPPQWSIQEAQQLAQEVELQLRSPYWREFVRNHLFSSKTKKWHDALEGWERLRYIVNALSRIRYCDSQGVLDFDMKLSPESNMHPNYQAWFLHKNRRNKDMEIFFGHWSTLGAMDGYHVHATDTGCLWGGKLTAFCLETRVRHTFECPQSSKPKSAKQGKKSK